MTANDILFRYMSSGASKTTAWPQSKWLKDKKIVGVEASQTLAKEDLPKLKPYTQLFLSVARTYDLPPALLAAIASRESRGGAALTDDGWGDNYNGFGLMQVDRQNDPKGGPYSKEHVEQATKLLRGSIDEVKKNHRDWSPEDQLRGGVAAYNFGAKNVWTIPGMDQGTTGDDYSSDVWARAQFLAPEFGGVSSTVVAATPPPREPAPAPKTPAAGGSGTTSLPVVHDLQLFLTRHGYMTEAEVRTGPGVLGPKTRSAIARFLKDKSPSFTAPQTPTTPQTPTPTAPSVPTTPVAGGAGVSLGEGFSVDTNNPILKTLATGTLKTGADHSCVRTTLDNMSRLGVKDIPLATGSDKNNSRGAMAQMLANGKWDSLPLVGSHTRTIKSPYATVTAYVIGGSEYKKMALAGQIPSGAISSRRSTAGITAPLRMAMTWASCATAAA